MTYIQLSITSRSDQADAMADALHTLDALSVTITDAKDTPVFQLQPDETPLWPEVKITALFDEHVSPRDIIEQLKIELDTKEPINYRIEKVADQDWVRLTQEHFKPQCFNDQLWIRPRWFDEPLAGTVVTIDPGLAFGTGTHPTTHLCLDWIAKQHFAGKTVLDYGCGSGILSLAALAQGADHVTAIDHDSQALEATFNNAALNTEHLDIKQLIVQSGDAPLKTPFDVCIANILANPLIELANIIGSAVKPRGTLVLSGILEYEANNVASAYQAAFEVIEITEQEGWVRMILSKIGE